jgi:transposase
MGNRNQNRVIVLAVVNGGLSAIEASTRFGVTRQWIHILLARYRDHGEDGLTPRSRRPRHSPSATPDAVRTDVLRLRDDLTSSGLDAGAESIHARLHRDTGTAPSVPTIWRILRAGGTVTQ